MIVGDLREVVHRSMGTRRRAKGCFDGYSVCLKLADSGKTAESLTSSEQDVSLLRIRYQT